MNINPVSNWLLAAVVGVAAPAVLPAEPEAALPYVIGGVIAGTFGRVEKWYDEATGSFIWKECRADLSAMGLLFCVAMWGCSYFVLTSWSALGATAGGCYLGRAYLAYGLRKVFDRVGSSKDGGPK